MGSGFFRTIDSLHRCFDSNLEDCSTSYRSNFEASKSLLSASTCRHLPSSPHENTYDFGTETPSSADSAPFLQSFGYVPWSIMTLSIENAIPFSASSTSSVVILAFP